MGTLAYIKNFIQDRDVASVTPSSKFLVKRVCRWIDFSKPCTVVEYGPGTGVFSRHILSKMTPDSTLLMIESNKDFVDRLEDDFADADPRTIAVHDRAENAGAVLREHDLSAADYVVSGIPFSFLDDEAQAELLRCTRDILTDDGKFLVYQVRNHMDDLLRTHFENVNKEYELRNLPPMFAYEATE
jgi:phospholipid N-methyltransferase